MEIQMSSTRKRTRSLTKSSARRALESTVAQFDELLATAELKEGKRGDVLIAKANALKELLALEADDREAEGQDTIARLEDQHAKDTPRIAELEAANVALRAKSEVVREIPDPEHAAVRQQNEALTAALKLAGSSMGEDERQRLAIRGMQELTQDAARLLCYSLNLNFNEQWQMLTAYRTDAQLQDVIDKAQIAGPAVIFARAALALRGVKLCQFEDWH
jgi:hypothetical protein